MSRVLRITGKKFLRNMLHGLYCFRNCHTAEPWCGRKSQLSLPSLRGQ